MTSALHVATASPARPLRVTETFGAKSSENADFRPTSAGRVTFVPMLREAR